MVQTQSKKIKKKNRNSGIGPVSRAFFIIIGSILFIYGLVTIILLLWGLMTAFKSDFDYSFANNTYKLPNWSNERLYHDKNGKPLFFSSFAQIFSDFKVEKTITFYSGDKEITHVVNAGFGQMILNSIIYALGCSVIQAFVPAITAYLLAKYKFKFSKFLYALTLIVYIIPIIGNYPSVIATLRGLQLYDTWFGIFIQKFNFCGMYFFVFYAFFESFPDAYIEAAELDGANQFDILFRIVLPQAKQIILTVMLIVFVQLWNDYQTPLMYLPTHPTISYGVYLNTMHDTHITIPTRMAGCISLALPILVLFIFLKDRLMSNVSMGGIKE